MAVTVFNAATKSKNLPGVPVSVMGDWMDICTDIDTADNAGSTVLDPVSISRAEQGRLNIQGRGTSVQFRIKYTIGLTITAGTIQPFGLDSNGLPDRLFDASAQHALAFVSDAANDPQDGTNAYTATQEVDGNGATQVIAAIKVAATGTGAATATLQARIK